MKQLPLELIHEAARRGLSLRPCGDKLEIRPARLCPPEFAAVLREYKAEILVVLEGRAAGLTDDCAPWLHVAKQILAGEFEGADDSTVQSLTIGLRSIHHPLCQKALAQLAHYKSNHQNT